VNQVGNSKKRHIGASAARSADSTILTTFRLHWPRKPSYSQLHNVGERLPYTKRMDRTRATAQVRFSRFAGPRHDWISRTVLPLFRRTMLTSRCAICNLEAFAFTARFPARLSPLNSNPLST